MFYPKALRYLFLWLYALLISLAFASYRNDIDGSIRYHD